MLGGEGLPPSLIVSNRVVLLAGLAEWSMAPDCKSGGDAYVGSNPSPGTYGKLRTECWLSTNSFRLPLPQNCPRSSVAEHFFGKEEVTGPIPVVGLAMY